NDIDANVVAIHQYLMKQAYNPNKFFKEIQQRIEKYGFSHSYLKDIVPQELKNQFKKTYYAKHNRQAFQKLKEHYNNSTEKDILDLYLLLIYGFNRMLRFNSKGLYNLPVGNVDFNKNVYNALHNYFYLVKNKNITFYNLDFKEFLLKINFQKDDFLYFDPPYLITFSEYNKLWNEEKELELLEILDNLNNKNIKFAISDVTNYKGKVNHLFLDWSKKYFTHNIKSNYISYHDNSIKTFKEVLVTNYKPKIVIQTNIFEMETDNFKVKELTDKL
ncbi:MAG: DNA adenine methylase, partial [Bacteroidales bacterium]|nr:DNA adenine methylase [Bacteroidales bacterium]